MSAHCAGLAAVSLLKWFGLGGPAQTTLHSLRAMMQAGWLEAATTVRHVSCRSVLDQHGIGRRIPTVLSMFF